jgi:lipid A 3-O-deacylase
MRVACIIGLSLLIAGAGSSPSVAADKKRQAPPPAAPSLLSEFRFGFSAQDPWGPENGSANGTIEIMFAKPFTPADLFTSYFVPRPHLGGSVNFDGKTSYAYAGLTWSLDITSQFFVEGSVGGAVHNGDTHPFATPVDRAALGCSPLFREAGSIGVRLGGNWSMMATLEHMSDGGDCAPNRGLTNIGARVGYTF